MIKFKHDENKVIITDDDNNEIIFRMDDNGLIEIDDVPAEGEANICIWALEVSELGSAVDFLRKMQRQKELYRTYEPVPR